MIPTGGSLSPDSILEIQEPSLTYRLDLNRQRIIGRVDGLEAIRQAVYKILQTERFDYLIYSFDYGVELEGLIGRSPEIVKSELARRIREALLEDDRIRDITDMQITISGDCTLAAFTVVTDIGEFEEEVSVNV